MYYTCCIRNLVFGLAGTKTWDFSFWWDDVSGKNTQCNCTVHQCWITKRTFISIKTFLESYLNCIQSKVFKDDANYYPRSGWKICRQKSKQRYLYNYCKWTMKDCSNEIVKILSRRQKDICCVQELWWIGESAWINYGDKFSWKGNNSGNGGVEVLVVKKWIDKVIGSTT